MLVCVAACPQCRRVQVFDAATARPRCRACGTAFELSTRRSFYTGEDSAEARRVASRVALQVAGAGIEAIAESAAAVEAERSGSLEDVVRFLEGLAEFGEPDVAEAMRRVRLPGAPDRVVALLLRENRLFEPRPGRFRWVQ